MANPNQDMRDSSGRYRRTITTAQRDAHAAQMHADGASYREIADELGYSSKHTAIQAVRRAIKDVVQGPAEEVLKLHTARLEYAFAKAMEIAETDHVVVSHGKIIKDDDGNPLKDSAPVLAALREARAALGDFRKMMGLEVTKVEHSGGLKYEVVGIDPDTLT